MVAAAVSICNCQKRRERTADVGTAGLDGLDSSRSGAVLELDDVRKN